MKEVTLEGPNGEEIIIDVPDNASDDDIKAFAQQNVGKFNQAQDGERELEWGEVGEQAWKNLPKSAIQLGKDLLQVVRHPIDTASSVLDLGMGIIELAIPGEQGDEKTARAVGQAILKRYHGSKNIKKTMATDPVGFVSDLSAALTGGGTALSKIGQIGGKLSKTYGISNGQLAGAVKQGIKDTPIHDAGTMATRSQMGNQLSRGGVASPDLPRKPNWLENSGDWLAKAGSNIDPMRQTGRGIAGLTKGGASIFGDIQGKLTGTGHDVMRQNFSAGLRNSEAWKKGMDYADDSDALVTEAMGNIKELKYDAQNRYQFRLAEMLRAKPKTSWTPILRKMNKLSKSMYDPVTGKHPNVRDTAELEKIAEMSTLINEVMSDPKLHNAAGFDWLKQRLYEVDIPEKMKTASRLKHGTTKSIHSEISRAYPAYRTMQDEFHKFKKLEEQLDSAFGKDKHTALDQTLRKLHQAMRNNANTGRKRGLLREIDPTQALADQIAGQASRETMPRGMMGVGGPAAAAGVGALGSTGGALALVGLGSPKAMGKLNYTAGKYASPFARAGEALGPKGGRALSQGLIQAGRVKQIDDEVDHEMTLKKKAPKKKKRK
tara:strand:- start:1068 stop:2876 length:1809 start_codon:yes stop_codon:yes gene_type:complete